MEQNPAVETLSFAATCSLTETSSVHAYCSIRVHWPDRARTTTQDRQLLPLLGNVKHHDDSITVLVHIQKLCIQSHLIWLQHTNVHINQTSSSDSIGKKHDTCILTPYILDHLYPLWKATHSNTWAFVLNTNDTHLLGLVLQFQIVSASFAFAWMKEIRSARFRQTGKLKNIPIYS